MKGGHAPGIGRFAQHMTQMAGDKLESAHGMYLAGSGIAIFSIQAHGIVVDFRDLCIADGFAANSLIVSLLSQGIKRFPVDICR